MPCRVGASVFCLDTSFEYVLRMNQCKPECFSAPFGRQSVYRASKVRNQDWSDLLVQEKSINVPNDTARELLYAHHARLERHAGIEMSYALCEEPQIVGKKS